MKNHEKIFTFLIILSGLFFFKIGELERFFPAQKVFMFFSAFVLWGFVLYQKNKWIGIAIWLTSIGFLNSMLLCRAPHEKVFEFMLGAFSISFIYYCVRYLELKKNILKILMIPVIINIFVVFIQKFDHVSLPGLPVEGVTGLLGNKSFVGYYIAIISPVFWFYRKKFIPLIAATLIICTSFFGQVSFLVTSFIYILKTEKKRVAAEFLVLVALIVAYIFLAPDVLDSFIPLVKRRLCLFVGTLDGIKHNPLLGWGIGSFEMISNRIPYGDIIFFGQSFTSHNVYVNHPHNSVLYGWWSLGIAFPILLFFFIKDFLSKYTKDKLLPFLILLGGGVCSIGTFLTPPLWIAMAMALGVYENEKE